MAQSSKKVQVSKGHCDFGSLAKKLDKKMAMAISMKSLDANNNPLTD